MTDDEVVVIGAGGHALVVVSTLEAQGRTVPAVYDDDPSKIGDRLAGVPVEGPVDQAEDASHPAIVAIGDNRARQRIAETLDVDWARAIHPSAVVPSSVDVGEGSVVFAGAIVQPQVSLGPHSIVNTAASVDHGSEVGAYAHVGPNATLCGNAAVREGATAGAGSVLTPGVELGPWSTAGAGAVVTGAVPDGETVVGVPARTTDRTQPQETNTDG